MEDKTEWKIGEGSYTEYRYRKNDDKKYVSRQHSPKTLKKNPDSFYSKWGRHATDIAKEENVSTECIHMRVMLYGHPLQRKAKPSLAEKIHNKTEYELACELDMHPQSVRRKLQLYGDAYHVRYHMIKDEQGNRTIRCKGDCGYKSCKDGIYQMPLKGSILGLKDWRDWPRYKNDKYWLHPAHPDYPASRGDKI